MKHQTNSQRLFKWLRDNEIKLGALTDHDARALRAAAEIAEAWLSGDYRNRKLSELAFNNMVLQMQPTTRFMAFHSIAMAGDWCHRWELWRNAGLPPLPANTPECLFGPKKRSEEHACSNEQTAGQTVESKAQLP